MQQSEIIDIFEAQKQSCRQRKLHSYEARILALERLKEAILQSSDEIEAALKKDLGKSRVEAYISEIQFVISEINYALKHLKKWMKPKRVKTPLVHLPAKSYIVKEPLGTVLIISPWNYPFQLLMAPLVGARAAGNTAILKPSELAPATSRVIAKLISMHFEKDELAVVEGAVQETTWLLELPFDHIFYTGNGNVGRIVMEKAAVNLTPVTLELGGKSPCFIFGRGNIDLTAKRIVWGKFFNTGQTCIAPDYILVDPKYKRDLVEKMEKYIRAFYGSDIKKSPDYGRIVNERHFKRLSELIEPNDLLLGGSTDAKELFIEPTVVNADGGSRIMEDEIFGPLLPVLEFDSFDDALAFVKERPKPLATYVFSNDDTVIERCQAEISAGGMCINDTLIHISTDQLPFGGVGPSGMGRYHGYFSFELFSHLKSVMKRSFFLDLAVRYPPYTGKLKILKWLLKFLG